MEAFDGRRLEVILQTTVREHGLSKNDGGYGLRDGLRALARFSIGICASDDASNLHELLAFIENEAIPIGLTLSRIIVMTSGCSPESLEYALEASRADPRISFIVESKRNGKADALNKIFKCADGEFLVLLNADAFPSKGSIRKLLEFIVKSGSTGIVSACPYIDKNETVLANLQEFMWTAHNESSLLLNHMGLSNHSNDEMMVVRSNLLSSLPYGLVNDGAYISARAKMEGFSIEFCQDARIRIQVPSRVSDSIGQRRRIIFGHLQVMKFTGQTPMTVESMIFFKPLVSFKILGRTLAGSPRFLAILPVGILCETISLILALIDFSSSTKKHRIWRRYGD